MIYFYHRSVQLGSYCTIHKVVLNCPNLPVLTTLVSIAFNSLQVCVCLFFGNYDIFIYKTEEKLGVLKSRKIRTIQILCIKMICSETADSAHASHNRVRNFVRAFV